MPTAIVVNSSSGIRFGKQFGAACVSTKSMTLENGLQIWQALLRSGLEQARKHDLPGYDAELIARLKQVLYPNAMRSLEEELRSAPPSTESFLDAFFNALKPFSQMLREVLLMFEEAGARRSDENLRIAFDFDSASKPLALTFRSSERSRLSSAR